MNICRASIQTLLNLADITARSFTTSRYQCKLTLHLLPIRSMLLAWAHDVLTIVVSHVQGGIDNCCISDRSPMAFNSRQSQEEISLGLLIPLSRVKDLFVDMEEPRNRTVSDMKYFANATVRLVLSHQSLSAVRARV